MDNVLKKSIRVTETKFGTDFIVGQIKAKMRRCIQWPIVSTRLISKGHKYFPRQQQKAIIENIIKRTNDSMCGTA